jgi:hypothetical protein
MNANIDDLLEASIRLELLVADLYLKYSEKFPEDKNFWWEISIEEKNHAALLKSGRIYLDKGIFPAEIVEQNHAALEKSLRFIEGLIAKVSSGELSKAEAYNEARKIEASAAELHYQKLMEGVEGGDSKVASIFRSLGGDDRDHEERISGLISRHGLQLPEAQPETRPETRPDQQA